MQSEKRYFCPACGIGLTEDDIKIGDAIRRFKEVYCIEHFQQKFPNECLNHPGTVATNECARCGARVCDNCIVNLADEKICASCKPDRLVEITTGNCAQSAVEGNSRPDPEMQILWAAVVSIVVPLGGFYPIIHYFMYRKESFPATPDIKANIALILSVVTVIAWILLLVNFLG